MPRVPSTVVGWWYRRTGGTWRRGGRDPRLWGYVPYPSTFTRDSCWIGLVFPRRFPDSQGTVGVVGPGVVRSPREFRGCEDTEGDGVGGEVLGVT